MFVLEGGPAHVYSFVKDSLFVLVMDAFYANVDQGSKNIGDIVRERIHSGVSAKNKKPAVIRRRDRFC